MFKGKQEKLIKKVNKISYKFNKAYISLLQSCKYINMGIKAVNGLLNIVSSKY